MLGEIYIKNLLSIFSTFLYYYKINSKVSSLLFIDNFLSKKPVEIRIQVS